MQIKHPEEHPVDSEEKAIKAQVPSPKSKAELALIIEQKLKSFYSKNNEDEEEEEDANPRRKYLVDIRTQKKYIYNNEERGIFRFTSDGGLAFTIFYSEFFGKIPSSQLGLQTMDSNNRIQYSNVEQIRSLDEEEADQHQGNHGPGLHDALGEQLIKDLQGVQGGDLQGDQREGHRLQGDLDGYQQKGQEDPDAQQHHHNYQDHVPSHQGDSDIQDQDTSNQEESDNSTSFW